MCSVALGFAGLHAYPTWLSPIEAASKLLFPLGTKHMYCVAAGTSQLTLVDNYKGLSSGSRCEKQLTHSA